MELIKYRITNFRTIEDSGWIKPGDNINNLEKSRLFNALWKFNPINGQGINLIDDVPVSKFYEYTEKNYEIVFASCEFITKNKKIIEKIMSQCKAQTCREEEQKIIVSKTFIGRYIINFLGCKTETINYENLLYNIIKKFERKISRNIDFQKNSDFENIYIAEMEKLSVDEYDDLIFKYAERLTNESFEKILLYFFNKIIMKNKKIPISDMWFENLMSDIHKSIINFVYFLEEAFLETFLLKIISLFRKEIYKVWKKYIIEKNKIKKLENLIIQKMPKFNKNNIQFANSKHGQ